MLTIKVVYFLIRNVLFLPLKKIDQISSQTEVAFWFAMLFRFNLTYTSFSIFALTNIKLVKMSI